MSASFNLVIFGANKKLKAFDVYYFKFFKTIFKLK